MTRSSPTRKPHAHSTRTVARQQVAAVIMGLNHAMGRNLTPQESPLGKP